MKELNAAGLVAALEDAHAAYLQPKFPSRPVGVQLDRVWASRSRACVRQMALDLTNPDDREPFDLGAMSRMIGGREREDNLHARFIHMGKLCDPTFEVIHGQKSFFILGRLKDETGKQRPVVSGKIDGQVRFDQLPIRPVFEIKSGEAVKQIKTLDDFARSRWTRSMPDQLLLYMLAEGEPIGLLVLDQPAGPRLIPLVLEDHLERAETFLDKAEQAVAHRFGQGPLPDFVQDYSECRFCDHFGKTCHPTVDFGEGIRVFDDPELIAAANDRDANQEAHRKFESSDKRLKAAMRGVEYGQVGDFQITGKWAKKTWYEYPANLQDKYRRSDNEGRWTVKIERVVEPSSQANDG